MLRDLADAVREPLHHKPMHRRNNHIGCIAFRLRIQSDSYSVRMRKVTSSTHTSLLASGAAPSEARSSVSQPFPRAIAASIGCWPYSDPCHLATCRESSLSADCSCNCTIGLARMSPAQLL